MMRGFEYLESWGGVSVAFRLVLAMLAGGLVGFERGKKHRAAGFRTHMLVCMGATLSMLLGQYHAGESWGMNINPDVSRFGAQVVNGIGFLAAGTIIVTGRQEVKGLTTAAGLWASACMGLAIGAGYYACVFAALLAILLVVRMLPILEGWMLVKARNINIYIEFSSVAEVGRIISCLKGQQVRIYDMELIRSGKNGGQRPGAYFALRLNKRQNHTKLLLKLSELDCVYSIEEL